MNYLFSFFRLRRAGQFLLLSLSFAVLSFRSAFAATDVYLGLQAYGANGKMLGVGLAPFTSLSNDSESANLTKALRSVMREDLLFEHLFTIVRKAARLPGISWTRWDGAV